jgi:L-fuconolactonase
MPRPGSLSPHKEATMRMVRLSIHLLLVMMAGSANAASVPFKMFDGHLHPVSDDTQRYPRVPDAGNPAAAFPGAFVMPPGVGGQPGGMGSTQRAETDIDKRVLAWMDEQGVEAIADVQKRGSYGTDNRYTVDAAAAHPQRLFAVVILDPQDAGAPAQLRDLISNHGIAGLRLTGSPAADGTFPWLSSPAALELWKIANDAGIVIDIMITNQDNSTTGVPEIARLAKAYPKVRLVLDHALYPKVEGGPDYGINAAYATLAAQKNVYFKFTTINLDFLREAHLPAPEFVRRLVTVYGADHVLWGSDLGNSGGTYPELVARIIDSTSKLTATERKKVLRDTGKAVFVRGGKR